MNFMDFDCEEMKWIETHRLQKDLPIPWKRQKQFSVLASNYNSCVNEIGYTETTTTWHYWTFDTVNEIEMSVRENTCFNRSTHNMISCFTLQTNQTKAKCSTILVVIYGKLNDLPQTNMASTKSTERNM